MPPDINFYFCLEPLWVSFVNHSWKEHSR